MKSSLKKTFVSSICALVFVAASVAPVSAANTGDTPFRFTVPDAGYYRIFAPGRRKDNSSSMYIYYQSGPRYNTRFSGHGGITDYQALKNCTVGDSAIIEVGMKRRLRTNIYEWGYTYAFIGGCNNAPPNQEIAGVWSPDCAGNYPYAN